jgi:hypothetical protein
MQISDTTVVVTGFDTIVGVFADKPPNPAGRDTLVRSDFPRRSVNSAVTSSVQFPGQHGDRT